jgi:alkylation response protein AidB-like acyl-CoA dehydrogenase
MLQEEVRRFAEEVLRPRIGDADREGKLDPTVVPALFEMGLMAVEVPEELGGAGMSFTMAILAVEELARVDPSVAVVMDVQNTLVNNCILRWASDEQKKRWLTRLSSGTVGAYALSEAEAGSDAFALKARAVPDGSEFVLTGQKLWITNGGEAGQVGKGYKVAIETLNEGRIGIGGQMVGLAQGSLDATTDYVKERAQFGKPLAAFQGVQFALAEMACELEAARLTVYNAARLKDAGESFVREAAIAKWFAAEVAERVSSKAVDLFGGYGFSKDYPVEKLYRDAKIGKIYEGTSFMQLQTIAKMMLG